MRLVVAPWQYGGAGQVDDPGLISRRDTAVRAPDDNGNLFSMTRRDKVRTLVPRFDRRTGGLQPDVRLIQTDKCCEAWAGEYVPCHKLRFHHGFPPFAERPAFWRG